MMPDAAHAARCNYAHADCTFDPAHVGDDYAPPSFTHAQCPGNAQLYNGLIAPLVNTSIKGWLWCT